MANAVENEVITLLSQHDAPPWQLGPEPTADQYDRRRSPLFRYPFLAPFTALVNRPFDLNVCAVPDIAGGHEVAQNPSTAVFPIYLGIPGMDQICHGERR
jgi:hypothetical protein